MKMDTGMYQRIEQRQLLKLSPQMIQQIEILQLATLELQQLVKQELEQNPALEIETELPQTSTAQDGEEKIGSEVPPPGGTEDNEAEAQEDAIRYIEEQHEFIPRGRLRSASAQEDSDPMDAMQNAPARGETLQDFLHKQATLVELNGKMRRLLDYLIDCLDDSGYLSTPLGAIVETQNKTTLAAAAKYLASRVPLYGTIAPAQAEGDSAGSAGSKDIPYLEKTLDQLYFAPGAQPPAALDAALSEFLFSIADAEAVLRVVQTFDPKGVGARDLKECLFLQLSETDADCQAKQMLIRDHLDDIVHNNLPAVQKKASIPMEQLNRLIDQIKAMNPKPGTNISGISVPRVAPDVVVERIEDSYEVRIEKSFLPPLCISPQYSAILMDKGSSPEAKLFVRAKVDAAKRLIGAIEQRRSTLQRIAIEIVKSQKDFLDKGIAHLRPFKMQEVADKIGVHVSTVGRAIAEKYILTPRGIFKMKFFFTGGIDMTDGKAATSRVSILARIKDLFGQEEKTNPLNDDEAVEILRKEGYVVARRTVAKYRQELDVPSARMRRKY